MKSFKERHNHSSYDTAINDLLRFHPDAPGSRRAGSNVGKRESQAQPKPDKLPDADVVEDVDTDVDLLKAVIITRLIVEGMVPVVKIPLILALCAMLFFGRVNVKGIISSSTAARLMADVFSHDGALLRSMFTDVNAVHLQTDLSTRQNEERMSIWLTFAKPDKPALQTTPTLYERNAPSSFAVHRRIVWSGAITSKEGCVQFDAVKRVLQFLGVYLLLASFTTDGGKDALGQGIGLLGRLNRDLPSELFHVMCDLHVLNRALVCLSICSSTCNITHL